MAVARRCGQTLTLVGSVLLAGMLALGPAVALAMPNFGESEAPSALYLPPTQNNKKNNDNNKNNGNNGNNNQNNGNNSGNNNQGNQGNANPPADTSQGTQGGGEASQSGGPGG